MECEKPSASLVHALCDEIRREKSAVVYGLLVLEGIMELGVRHRPGVEPHVDKIKLALHGFAIRGHEHDVVDIRAVQIDFIVISLGVVAGHEAFFTKRIGLHNAGCNSLFYFIIKRLDGVDADFLRP